MADVERAFERLIAQIKDHISDLQLSAAEAAVEGDYPTATGQLEQAEAAEDYVRRVQVLRQEWQEAVAGSEPVQEHRQTRTPSVTPDLKFTRVLEASFGSRAADNWNDLLRQAHREAMARLGSFEAVRRASSSNIVKGKRTSGGYTYMPDVDISIQGVTANRAWEHAKRLARRMDVPIRALAIRKKAVADSHIGERIEIAWTPQRMERGE